MPPVECSIAKVNTSQRDSWLTGAMVDIRWSGNGVPGTVVIELLKAGDVVATIAPSAANTGFFPWQATTGGQAGGTDFGVRVTGTGNANCGGEVNDLTILDVNSCDIAFTAELMDLQAGNEFEITWTGDQTSGLVDIELWTSGLPDRLGDLVGPIAVDEPDDGSFTWTVKSFNYGTYDFYRYVIRDVQIPDCQVMSPQFSIQDDEVCSTAISGPSSVELNNGDTLLIQLEQVNGSGVVNLRLYSGNEFVAGGVIGNNVSVLDDLAWEVSDFGHTGAHNRYNIRAIDVVDPFCIDSSNSFTINP